MLWEAPALSQWTQAHSPIDIVSLPSGHSHTPWDIHFPASFTIASRGFMLPAVILLGIKGGGQVQSHFAKNAWVSGLSSKDLEASERVNILISL